MGFKYKTVRCEWLVVIQDVDQYGMSTKDREILGSHSTHEEAVAAMPSHGREHEWVKGCWIPFNPQHSYRRLEVQYREVLVDVYERIEVDV